MTRRPSTNEVSVSENCNEKESKFVQCPGELNGNYRWKRENSEKNYILFILNQRSDVALVNVTYRIQSSHQTPKVSFCDIPNSFKITESNDFNGLNCKELTSILGGTQDVKLPMVFNNETSMVGMEVITQGIKTDFEVMRVQFFSDQCTAATITGIFPSESAHTQ